MFAAIKNTFNRTVNDFKHSGVYITCSAFASVYLLVMLVCIAVLAISIMLESIFHMAGMLCIVALVAFIVDCALTYYKSDLSTVLA